MLISTNDITATSS